LDSEESWVPKNWCFWTVSPLRVPWTARRSNQSILKETSPGCSLEGLMLKLKLQDFGHLIRRVDLLEKSLMLGGIRGRRRRGRQRMRWPDGIIDWWMWDWVNSGSWWWTGRPGVLRFMGLQRVGHDWATELNWEQGDRGRKAWGAHREWEHCVMRLEHAVNEAERLEIGFPTMFGQKWGGLEPSCKAIYYCRPTRTCSSSYR